MSKSFSIIIPHRDCPELLQRCLDSIPFWEDIQIIVVDDNSNPSIVDFDRFPGKNRDDVKIILTKEGKGAGFARNVGLEHAEGKWLLFLDSDDFLLPSVIDIFDKELDAKEDIIYYRPKFVFSDNLDLTSSRGGSVYNRYIDDYFETGNEMELRTRWHSPWSKIIKRSLVTEKNIRFDETKYSNDVMFSTLVGCMANRIGVRDNSFYVVTEREGSLTSRFCQKEGELVTRASVFFNSQQIVREFSFPLDEELAARYLRRLFYGNRHLFKYYFKLFRQLSGGTRIQLLNKIFEFNRPLSRIKRMTIAFFITMF